MVTLVSLCFLERGWGGGSWEREVGVHECSVSHSVCLLWFLSVSWNATVYVYFCGGSAFWNGRLECLGKGGHGCMNAV